MSQPKTIPCQCENCSAKFVIPTLGFMKVIILMIFAAYVFGIATAHFTAFFDIAGICGGLSK